MCVRFFGHHAAVAMTSGDFLDAPGRDVPEAQSVVAEHLEDNDVLLLHLLTGDLRRFAFHSFEMGRRDVLERLLALVDLALREGTDHVRGAMTVSFVGNTEWWDPAMQPFIDTWPAGLRAEVHRQRSQNQ
jgi:hypothetical protein